jgi:hypothetical protein
MIFANSNFARDKWWFLASGVVILVGFLTFFARPLDALPWQWADDALYFNNAKAFLNHFGETQWLGPFDQITLSKGPFFPIFLGAIHTISLPLRVAEFLLYLALPFMALRVVSPLGLAPGRVLFLASVFFLFIPVLNNELRLGRGVLFGFILIFFLLCLLAIVVRGRKGTTTSVVCWSGLAGFAFGLASITREEASWMLLPAAVAFAAYFVANVSRKKLNQLILILMVAWAAYSLPVQSVSIVNEMAYGMDGPSLRQNGSFRRLYSVLSSLEPATRKRFVPILTEVRAKAYGLSTHFKEIEPFLEGPALDNIAYAKGHHHVNNWHSGEREFFVSNFEFALSKAIVLSGRDEGKSFMSFCDAVSDELDAAIRAGDIDAGGVVLPMLAPISSEDIWPVVKSSAKSLGYLVLGKGLRFATPDSANIPDGTMEWHAFLRTWPPLIENDKYRIQTDSPEAYVPIKIAYEMLILPIILLSLTCAAVVLVAHRNRDSVCNFFFPLTLGIAGVMAFSLVMGIVNEIGFPMLKYPYSYNRLGFYPLHFLLFVCGISFLLTETYFKKYRARINPLKKQLSDLSP